MNEYDLLATINEKYFTINKSLFVKNLCKNNTESVDDNSMDTKTNSCDVWSMQNGNGITLLEDEDPWYKNKQSEHEKLLQNNSNTEDYNTENTQDIKNTQDTQESEDNDKSCFINFNVIACSLLFIISLMISFRFFWR